MARSPGDRSLGAVEWILIIILVIMVVATLYFLLEPAMVNLWEHTLESIQE